MWSVVFALATFHDYLYGYTEIVQTYHRPVSQHRLISYRAGAWHYRIFPDFLNSGFKMASKTEGKAEVIACS